MKKNAIIYIDGTHAQVTKALLPIPPNQLKCKRGDYQMKYSMVL